MAYQSWSVVYQEQPSAAKWNILGTNDEDANTRLGKIDSFTDDTTVNYVASGCVWTGDSYGSTRYGSMTAGTVYINGQKVSVSAVTSRLFTASKDTYVDVDSNGALTYSEVANNASSPALAANSIRLAIIVTAAGSIASKYRINQGIVSATTGDIYSPSSGVAGWNNNPSSNVIIDSLGNRICNKDPIGRLLSAYTRAGSATTGSPGGTSVSWNGMNYVAFKAEANTNYKFTFYEAVCSGWTASSDYWVFPLYLATAYNTYTTQIGDPHYAVNNSTPSGIFITQFFNSGTYSGLTYLNIKFRNNGFTGTMTINGDSARTGIYTIERA